MPTTEIATIPLVAGSQIGDPDNHAAGVHKQVANIVSQQDGFQALRFGMGLENPGTLQWLIDWDSKSKHEDFMAADAYTPFLNTFKTIIGGPFSLVHVDFYPKNGVERALSAPVTEVATLYYDGGPPSDAVESTEKFIKALEGDAGEGTIRWAYGITHEEVEKDDVKGKAAVLLIGWENREEHMATREKQAFKDNAQYLRQGAKAIEMHHTQFMNFVE